jgi:hypothetical protein
MKILILASGLSAKQIDDYDYKKNGWTIVAVNNAWQVIPNTWDYWIRANDYKGKRPEKIQGGQVEVQQYRDVLNQYGGHHTCGFSITLCASYYSLYKLKPKVIGFLGADMNYTPDENGNTHIYGVGFDIQQNGIPDPDRMVKRYGAGNDNYLNDIYLRFAKIAKENNCAVYNFSQNIETRLPYERVSVGEYDGTIIS